MQKNFVNQEFITGRLYQHNLVMKQVSNKDSKNFGKDFISGTIDVATDEEGLNVIPIHFTYVAEETSTGKKNATFGTLKSIIDGAKTWIVDGKDAAFKVRVSTALDLNDFYNQKDELVSAKRNEGGFVNPINELPPEDERSSFKFDMIITSTTRVEVENDEDYIRVKGGIFNFRKDLLPIEIVCRKESGGMDYFESLDASPANPVYTQVWGKIVSNVIKKEITQESAFGSATVRTVTNTVREWQITGARPVEYDFGEEDTITAEELKEAMQNRQVHLANIKKNRDDYLAQKAEKVEAEIPNAMNVPTGAFNF